MKCAFAWPVSATPGITLYQLIGFTSIHTAFAPRANPRITVNARRTSLVSPYLFDDRTAPKTPRFVRPTLPLLHQPLAVMASRREALIAGPKIRTTIISHFSANFAFLHKNTQVEYFPL